MKKTCKTCGYRHPQKNVCALYNRQIDLTADYCTWHKDHPPQCDYCGSFTFEPIIDMTNDNPVILCKNCFQRLDTCATCDFVQYCDFESNPIQIPPVVMKQFRQGNMTTVTQVKNPDRIRATCQVSCQCYDPEIGCKREIDNWCDKYKQIEVVKNDT